MRHFFNVGLLLTVIGLFSSCHHDGHGSDKAAVPSYLSGYWIPTEIKWATDNASPADTGNVFRTAFFHTLCFDSVHRFTLFGSTQRQSGSGGDSIIFAGEPVIKIFKGTWNLQDTTINVTCSLLLEESSTADTSGHRESLGMSYNPGDTLLRFNNQWYRRTDKYDQRSQQTIEKYKIALAK
jgi:hypothetical protein